MSVYCIYVEKKPHYAVEAGAALSDLRGTLSLHELEGVRILNRYLVEGLSAEDFAACRDTVFSEPPLDETYMELPDLSGRRVFATEFLPGQYDQRADSCAQCISLTTGGERPVVRCARIWVLEGALDDKQFEEIKRYLINPVESREATLELPDTLETRFDVPKEVAVLEGFITMKEDELRALIKNLGLAMDLQDLLFCRGYFSRQEKRDPTITELRMIDTYWSDHCRHTTFLTHIDSVECGADYIQKSWNRYLELREMVLGDKSKPVTLMDMATIGAKALLKMGFLNRLDQSEEINACSVNVRILVDGKPQDWLLMFKNETHNHPTEIEPFGGAATCLGGAIRDPLSGRSYVYQAMRITGAGDPLAGIEQTMSGKLPQRKITQTAAAGYSSYGNQIGLATGIVQEIYHPGYVAKRMELGAVLGAAPASNVKREVPQDGDIVILLGGRTGRDGCGGATGSSKSHTAQSLDSCGSEVQKGNPPEERKLQRLFRNPEATRLIRRCNDFGAGGVSVAIGELADGVRIHLDRVPKKYEGLDGTELAISESQERMAVVVAAGDAARFVELAQAENLEATPVAEVTAEPRLTMDWNGKRIVDLSREFLNSNGAAKHARAAIPVPHLQEQTLETVNQKTLCEHMASLEHCSQKGLMERFDSSIGAGTVLLPYGGARQLTPAQAMAAKFPVLDGESKATSLMSFAYDPHRASVSPYHGAMEAVVESIAKVIASGGSRRRCWLTFQEYYERLGGDPVRWGKPAAALLGALEAQMELQVASIGGKDSMSGSFEQLDVPPTMVSLAVSTTDADLVVSPEFKSAGHPVYLLAPSRKENGLVDFDDTRFIFDIVEQLVAGGKVGAAWALGGGGSAVAVAKMCLGNRLGLCAVQPLSYESQPGGFILEAVEPLPELESFLLGHTINEYRIEQGEETVDLDTVQRAWEGTLEPVFPCRTQHEGTVQALSFEGAQRKVPKIGVAKPLVAIPVFPGTNCEYDTARAVERAGGRAEIFVLRNLRSEDIARSVDEFAALLRRSQIVAIPGGFSGGDEPEGSAKLITAFFRNARLRAEVDALLRERDGLMCGICNGFQALVKLGLVPHGEIRDMDANSPTLTYNSIGRHQAMMVRARVSSSLSPWLSACRVGEVYTIPVSNGEGRFVASDAQIEQLAQTGQIATQYVNVDGVPTLDVATNPSGSAWAVEGVTSPDGRIFGKMAHCERDATNLYRNFPDYRPLDLFAGAVDYYQV